MSLKQQIKSTWRPGSWRWQQCLWTRRCRHSQPKINLRKWPQSGSRLGRIIEIIKTKTTKTKIKTLQEGQGLDQAPGVQDTPQTHQKPVVIAIIVTDRTLGTACLQRRVRGPAESRRSHPEGQTSLEEKTKQNLILTRLNRV